MRHGIIDVWDVRFWVIRNAELSFSCGRSRHDSGRWSRCNHPGLGRVAVSTLAPWVACRSEMTGFAVRVPGVIEVQVEPIGRFVAAGTFTGPVTGGRRMAVRAG